MAWALGDSKDVEAAIGAAPETLVKTLITARPPGRPVPIPDTLLGTRPFRETKVCHGQSTKLRSYCFRPRHLA
jgi:hypothetical protein